GGAPRGGQDRLWRPAAQAVRRMGRGGAVRHGRADGHRPVRGRGRADRPGGCGHRGDLVLPADVLLRSVAPHPVDARGAAAHQPRQPARSRVGGVPECRSRALASGVVAGHNGGVGDRVRRGGSPVFPVGVNFKAEGLMSNPEPHHFDVWERRERSAIAALPYAMLAFTAALTLFIRDSAREAWLIDLALCGLAAVWMLCLYTLVPAWRNRDPIRAVFFIGLIAIMTVLIIRNPWFGV